MKSLKRNRGASFITIIIFIVIIVIIVSIVSSNKKNKEEEKEYPYEYNYEDSNGDKAFIPEGFKVSETDNTIKDGLVVKAIDESEFVWIPVPTVVTNTEEEGTKNKAMAIQDKDGNYKALLYDFNGVTSSVRAGCTTTKSDYREPACIYGTGSEYDATSKGARLFDDETLQSNYNDMIDKVKKYGGFYIGRYETSIDEERETVVSKQGKEAMDATNKSGNTWYGMYQIQNEYARKNKIDNIVQSSMVWGSQYDAMLNWMLKGEQADKVTSEKTQHDRNKTGESSTDVINKIYDLESNLYEWTLEAAGTSIRVSRGSSFYSRNIPSYRNVNRPPISDIDSFGSRLTLYIK